MSALYHPQIPSDGLFAKFDDCLNEQLGLISDIGISKHNLLGPTAHICIARVRQPNAAIELGQGSSFSRHKALDGALGEALERMFAGARNREQMLFGSWNELHQKYNVLDPEEFPRREKAVMHFKQLTRDSALSWTCVSNVATSEKIYVPSFYVYMPNSPMAGEDIVDFSTSNGLAAGSTYENALASAVFELIERDAFALTWLFMRETPKLISWKGTPLEHFAAQFNDQIVVHNITTDLDIPVYMASFLGNSPLPRLAVGAGTSYSQELAVRKALEELAGSLYFGMTILESQEKTPLAADLANFDDHARYWTTNDSEEIKDWLRKGKKECAHATQFHSIDSMLAHLTTKGIRIFSTDLTVPELRERGVHVVRCVSPDLQPLWVGNDAAHFNSNRIKLARQAGVIGTKINTYPHPFP